MPTKPSPQTRLADAALRILAKKGWAELSLVEVAKSAKVPLTELAVSAPAKIALIDLILRRIGEKVAKTYKPDRAAQSIKERLFDVGMAWFDAVASNKAAMRALYDGLRRDPLTLLAARNAFIAAGEWLVTLAEADTRPAPMLRAAAFAAILGRTVPVWLDDDPDLSKTMARLDGDLRFLERGLREEPRS